MPAATRCRMHRDRDMGFAFSGRLKFALAASLGVEFVSPLCTVCMYMYMYIYIWDCCTKVKLVDNISRGTRRLFLSFAFQFYGPGTF